MTRHPLPRKARRWIRRHQRHGLVIAHVGRRRYRALHCGCSAWHLTRLRKAAS